MMVERRDQVFTTFLSRTEFICSIFLSRWSSTNGPFLRERAILLAPLHDEALGALVVARLGALRGLAPRSHRVAAAGRLALAAAMRMVHGVHGHAAVVRALAEPAGAPRLAEGHVLVV